MHSTHPVRNYTEEKLVWFGLTLTYPLFFLGGLYIMGSLIGWMIFAIVILRWFVNGKDELAIIPSIVWLWIVGGLFMLLALLVAHSNWDLGLAKTIKSSNNTTHHQQPMLRVPLPPTRA